MKVKLLILYMAAAICLVGVLQLQDKNYDYSQWECIQSKHKLVKLDINAPVIFNVTVTIYHPTRGQTDSTPNIVASGKRINIRKAGSHRYVAVSRDLLARWGGPLHYGDVVYIGNAGALSGYYFVEDTMNKRYSMRVDILRSPGAPLAKFDNAELYAQVN